MAPFIFKIKFYGAGDGAKNACHILYIGTRPGADRGEGDVEIGDRESYLFKFDTASGHVKYAATRPRSHGLFGPDEEKVPDLEAVQNELWQHKGIVWRAVLSLREDDATRMGFVDRKSWEVALRASVPEAASKMGIPEANLRWVAAFHAEPGHPHSHLVFWEAEPERKRGMLSLGESSGELKDVKKVFVRQIFAGERARLGAEKTALRDLIRDIGKGDIRELLREVKSEREAVRSLDGAAAGVPPRLNDEARAALGEKLEQIAGILPGKGRVALKYMPPEVKEKVCEAADWLLKQPGFSDSAGRYVEIAREMAGHYSTSDDALDKSGGNAYEDLRDRLGQEVLKGAVKIRKIPEKDGAAVLDEIIIEGDGEPIVDPDEDNRKVTGTFSSGTGGTGGSRGNTKKLPDELFKDAWRTVDRAVFRTDPAALKRKMPAFETGINEQVVKSLPEIAGLIPQDSLKGRIALAYLPQEVKDKARDLAGQLLESDAIKPLIEKYFVPAVADRGENEVFYELRERVAEQVVGRAAELLPKEIPQVKMLLHKGRVEDAIRRFERATAEYIHGDVDEAEWTAGTMYRALVRLGVDGQAAREAVERWADGAGLKEEAARAISGEVIKMECIAQECREENKPEPVHVSRKDWARLRENLCLEEEECLYPWFGILREQEQLPENEKRQEQEVIPHELVENRISSALGSLETAGGKPENYAEVYWTLRTYANTLHALGVGEEDRARMVREWVEKSEMEVSEARLRDVLDRITVLPREDFWLGRVSWKRLTENLGIQNPPESPWRVLVDRFGNVAGQVWKAAWRAAERERTKLEAQRLSFKRLDELRRKRNERNKRGWG